MGEDLSYYDQRLRYDTGLLLRLAESPLARGRCGGGDDGDGGGGGDSSCGGGGDGDASSKLRDLPAELRR
jgi:hypothetical protein